MLGRPYGADEDGRPIDHGRGQLILGAVECLQDAVAQRVTAEAPPQAPQSELAALIERAQDEALERLVAMLNAAIPDRRYHISREYLLNPNNYYSYEFRLFVSDYCRVISGDKLFFRHAGEHSIPRAVGLLARPLGIQRTYALLPRFTAKVIKTDLRVGHTGPTSAVIEWNGASQANLVPAAHREAYIRFACQIYQGAYSAIPKMVFGLPVAGVRELRCQADGADRCEWQFNWTDSPAAAGRKVLFTGIAASAGLGGALAAGVPGAAALAILGVAAPVGVAWQRYTSRRLLAARDNFERQLLEERDLAEEEYDRSEAAHGGLQRANVELSQRITELTALHEAALAISSTLDAEQILKAALSAVVGKLGYERAMVLLADDNREVLGRGVSVGADGAPVPLIAALEVPYSAANSPVVLGFLDEGPRFFQNVADSPDTAVSEFVRAIGASSFITTPLITKGRRVGVLAVDNAVTGRPLDVQGGSLLMTLGRQVAGAIEIAGLHEHVEAQNRTLEERVAHRTSQLEQAKAELEQELDERRRLRERELEYLDQVQRVVAAAAAVENETFDPASLAGTAIRDDELGQLARTFTRMAESMAAREQRLIREVQELRIEIDGGHQAERVADIVSTEYFQSLRSQANELRRIVSRG
jgi:GAF domain-containing protein